MINFEKRRLFAMHKLGETFEHRRGERRRSFDRLRFLKK